MEEVTCAVRRREERRRHADDATRDADEEATALGMLHSSRFTSIAPTVRHDPVTKANLMGLCIPTRRRTAMKMRPRDLRHDHFIVSLIKKRVRKEEKKSTPEQTVHEVTVDTQEEHEVAEALYYLANINMHDLPAAAVRQTKVDGLRSKPVLTKRKSQRTRRTGGGVVKRKASSQQSKRMAIQDDGSLSSGSFEKMPRSRTRSRSGRPCSTPFRKVFREGGKRVYHPQPKTSTGATVTAVAPTEQQPVRRHVIHQQPTRPRQKSQPALRVEEATPERVMVNGQSMRQEEKTTVSEERYLPKAVLDALKGIYGDGLVCTSNEQTTPVTTTTTATSAKQERPSTVIKRTDTTHSIQLKCEERSNESEAGTPVACHQHRSNSARHISTAQWIESHREKKKEEEVFVNRTGLAFSRNRIGDVMKNLPPPPPPLPVQKEATGIAGQFYPSLPLPSSFSNFSMSLQPLPQSLIQSLQNSASHVTPLQPRFPPLSGHPPPLVRASEPWETNR